MARFAAGIFFVLTFIGLAWHWPATVAPAVTLPPGEAHPSPAAAGYTGVGSCASAACHGGAKDSPFAWQRSYSIWSTDDKHSRAYQILFEDRAKRIVQLLDNLAEPNQARPFADTRCLGCHASVDPAAPQAQNMLADGVGCESCHGPARRWLVDHTAWPAANLRTLAESRDMKYTKDLRVLAGVCVGCHVGGSTSAASGGTVSRDMNHDMIAAGHPRLSFEFSAYLANMPRHWRARTDEAQAWAVGLAVTAQAALRLLADRADRAVNADAQKGPANWPEFSEYDCYRCHHDLRGGDSSQRLLLSLPSAERRKVGGYDTWGTWYVTMPGLLAVVQGNMELATGLTDLSRIMARPPADPKTIGNSARELATMFETLIGSLDKQRKDANWIQSTLVLVAGTPMLAWDEVAQAYLACVALNNERLWRRGEARSSLDGDIERQLLQIREHLRFGHRGKLQFDSPRDYDPLAVQAEFRRLRELFEKLGP